MTLLDESLSLLDAMNYWDSAAGQLINAACKRQTRLANWHAAREFRDGRVSVTRGGDGEVAMAVHSSSLAVA